MYNRSTSKPPYKKSESLNLTEQDASFIQQVFGKSLSPSDDLTAILNDCTLLRKLLDNELIYHAVIDDPDSLEISELLYYYVVTRQAMIRAGLDNTTYTDCISNSLVKMGQVFNSHAKNSPLIKQKYHPVNMTILTKETTGGRTLSIRAYMGTLLLVFDGSLQ